MAGKDIYIGEMLQALKDSLDAFGEDMRVLKESNESVVENIQLVAANTSQSIESVSVKPGDTHATAAPSAPVSLGTPGVWWDPELTILTVQAFCTGNIKVSFKPLSVELETGGSYAANGTYNLVCICGENTTTFKQAEYSLGKSDKENCEIIQPSGETYELTIENGKIYEFKLTQTIKSYHAKLASGDEQSLPIDFITVSYDLANKVEQALVPLRVS